MTGAAQTPRGWDRAAFSLLELILALAILGGALGVLSRIAETGTRAGLEARNLATARMLCQNKLAEVLLNAQLGVTPQTINDEPVEGFASDSLAAFRCSVEVQPGTVSGTLAVRVVVRTGESASGSCSLVRWIVDPALMLEQKEAEEVAAREAASEQSGGEAMMGAGP